MCECESTRCSDQLEGSGKNRYAGARRPDARVGCDRQTEHGRAGVEGLRTPGMGATFVPPGLEEPDWWLGVAPGRRRARVDRLDWVTERFVRGSEEIGGAHVGNSRDVRRVELYGAAS